MGIAAEFDTKNKHKMRVLQVERGVRSFHLSNGKHLIRSLGPRGGELSM